MRNLLPYRSDTATPGCVMQGTGRGACVTVTETIMISIGWAAIVEELWNYSSHWSLLQELFLQFLGAGVQLIHLAHVIFRRGHGTLDATQSGATACA